jgi:hypothetical protein
MSTASDVCRRKLHPIAALVFGLVHGGIRPLQNLLMGRVLA